MEQLLIIPFEKINKPKYKNAYAFKLPFLTETGCLRLSNATDVYLFFGTCHKVKNGVKIKQEHVIPPLTCITIDNNQNFIWDNSCEYCIQGKPTQGFLSIEFTSEVIHGMD